MVARRCGRHRDSARLRASPADEPRAVALRARSLAPTHAHAHTLTRRARLRASPVGEPRAVALQARGRAPTHASTAPCLHASCPYTRAAACGLRGEVHAQSPDLLRPAGGCDGGGRAARSDRPQREPRARRHPRHPCGDCRGGRPLHGIARCGVHIVAPDPARDADLDPLRRHEPGALGEAPGRRPHPGDVLPRACRRQLLPAPRRRLLRLYAGHRRQRIRPGVPLRRGDRRGDAGVGRRPVAELARTVLEPRRSDGVRLDAPQRRRPRHLRGGPGGPEVRSARAGGARRRLGCLRLGARRQCAAPDRVDLNQREAPLANGRRNRRQAAAHAEGRREDRVRRRPLRCRRAAHLRHHGPGLGVPASGGDRSRVGSAHLLHLAHPLGRRLVGPLPRRLDDRVRHQRSRALGAAPARH